MISVSNLVTIIAALLPAIFTVIGGQAILIRYRKSKEQEIELLRAVEKTIRGTEGYKQSLFVCIVSNSQPKKVIWRRLNRKAI